MDMMGAWNLSETARGRLEIFQINWDERGQLQLIHSLIYRSHFFVQMFPSTSSSLV
uniref:Uncharacterized protein n=1 Tax=Arundo donax TaxID=35708 RepID=A0A0A9C2F1_ARUDO